MGSFRALHTRILAVCCLAVAACSSGGGLGAGCACIKPLAAPYEGPKANNAVTAKISKAGFDYINTQWSTLLQTFLSSTNNTIHVPLPCMSMDVSVIGKMWICDQDFSASCSSGEGCNVSVKINNFRLDPQNAAADHAKITGKVTLVVDTGTIKVRSNSDSYAACSFFSAVKCNVRYDNASDPLLVTMDVNFSLDSRLDPDHPILAFDVANIQGIDDINSDDLDLSGANNCGDVWCGLGNLGFIKGFILDQLKPTLQQKIQDAVAAQRCRTCGQAGQETCPTGSTCDSNGVCQVGGGSGCVPRMLGLEGTITPGDTLGTYGVPPSAKLDISAVAGGSVASAALTSPKPGLTLGVIGGTASKTGDAPYLAPCVPDLPIPLGSPPPVPDFDGQSPDGGYQVGLGISQYFLNQAAYQAHRSGTFCLAISGQQVSLLSTGLFKTFLPSLGLVAGTETQDAPMMVTLRPLTAPEIDLGEGTYDPVTNQPINPLITVTMNNLVIDIYALVENRWSRLFTMQVNVKLPLSLIVNGCPQGITPAIGDLHQLLVVTAPPSNAEMLAEDPAVLQGLIPAIISFAQPALASALQPIAVPTISGFKIHINGLGGIGQVSGGNDYDNLGLFGTLELASASCDSASVHTTAELVRAEIPSAAQLHVAPGEKLPWPTAVIRAEASGNPNEAEFDYRVDHGLWSLFQPGPVLEVSDPRFLLEGHHTIEVRGRPAHGKGIADPQPAVVDFLVDWEAPEVHLVAQPDQNALAVLAKDNVSAPRALKYAYQVAGETSYSAFGPARPIDLQAIQEAGRLDVQVQDEAGNIGHAVYRSPTAVPTSGLTPAAGSKLPRGGEVGWGCGSVPGSGSGSLLALLPFALVLLGRRRRS